MRIAYEKNMHALPSADCLQLASAINLKKVLESAEEKLVLVCSDKDLCKASHEEGIGCVNPEEKDALERMKRIVT